MQDFEAHIAIVALLKPTENHVRSQPLWPRKVSRPRFAHATCLGHFNHEQAKARFVGREWPWRGEDERLILSLWESLGGQKNLSFRYVRTLGIDLTGCQSSRLLTKLAASGCRPRPVSEPLGPALAQTLHGTGIKTTTPTTTPL